MPLSLLHMHAHTHTKLWWHVVNKREWEGGSWWKGRGDWGTKEAHRMTQMGTDGENEARTRMKLQSEQGACVLLALHKCPHNTSVHMYAHGNTTQQAPFTATRQSNMTANHFHSPKLLASIYPLPLAAITFLLCLSPHPSLSVQCIWNTTFGSF